MPAPADVRQSRPTIASDTDSDLAPLRCPRSPALTFAGRRPPLDPSSIQDHCRERIAAFKRPRRLKVVSELPKTATGTIKRFALGERLAGPA